MMTQENYTCLRMVLAYLVGVFSAVVAFTLYAVCTIAGREDERMGSDE